MHGDDARILGGCFVNNVRCVIGACVVHHNGFKISEGLSGNAIKTLLEIVAHVVGSDDDCDLWHCVPHSVQGLYQPT